MISGDAAYQPVAAVDDPERKDRRAISDGRRTSNAAFPVAADYASSGAVSRALCRSGGARHPWSVSLYQGPNYVPNDIDRYDIAPWMPLNYGPDGSLDIYIQASSPGKDKEANWLPAPASGEFNIVIRNYWPKQEALDGTYKNPPIKKIS